MNSSRLIEACKLVLLVAGPSLLVAPFIVLLAPDLFLLGVVPFMLFWYVILGKRPNLRQEKPFRIALIIRYSGCLIIDLVGAFVIFPILSLPYTLRHNGIGPDAHLMTERAMVLPALLMQGIWLHLCVLMLFGIVKMILRQKAPLPKDRL